MSSTFPPNPYETPSMDTYERRSQTVLILGLLSIIFGVFTGIPAWVMGTTTINDARRNGIPESAVSGATTGRLIGMIVTILSIVSFVLFAILFVVALGSISTGPQPWPTPTV